MIASWTTIAFPVFFTLVRTLSTSHGTIVRRSRTSTEIPSSLRASAARSHRTTPLPQVIAVTSVPSRQRRATPNGSR